MNRSGYSDSLDQWQFIKWRGRVASALRGKRGQAFLIDLVRSLDALPEKRLCKDTLANREGEYCALGSVARVREMDTEKLARIDGEDMADEFGIAWPMAAEIMHVNDEKRLWAEGQWREMTPEMRWEYVRDWALGEISAETLLEVGGES